MDRPRLVRTRSPRTSVGRTSSPFTRSMVWPTLDSLSTWPRSSRASSSSNSMPTFSASPSCPVIVISLPRTTICESKAFSTIFSSSSVRPRRATIGWLPGSRPRDPGLRRLYVRRWPGPAPEGVLIQEATPSDDLPAGGSAGGESSGRRRDRGWSPGAIRIGRSPRPWPRGPRRRTGRPASPRGVRAGSAPRRCAGGGSAGCAPEPGAWCPGRPRCGRWRGRRRRAPPPPRSGRTGTPARTSRLGPPQAGRAPPGGLSAELGQALHQDPFVLADLLGDLDLHREEQITAAAPPEVRDPLAPKADHGAWLGPRGDLHAFGPVEGRDVRSEEHTSELQSR